MVSKGMLAVALSFSSLPMNICYYSSINGISQYNLPAIAARTIAASLTHIERGPIESCSGFKGMVPARDVKPTVGFNPTTLLRCAGYRILPQVLQQISRVLHYPLWQLTSPPRNIAARPRLAAMALPEEDPWGSWEVWKGPKACPNTDDHPFAHLGDLAIPHWLRLVFPKMIAPDSLRRVTTEDSILYLAPTRAYDPPTRY